MPFLALGKTEAQVIRETSSIEWILKMLRGKYIRTYVVTTDVKREIHTYICCYSLVV